MKQTQYVQTSLPNALCIIPARGGSKRIKDKNIRLFRGRPMIEWSIEAARSSKIFSRIIVSTDSEKISSVAKQAGAEVPFMRPKSLADDYTDTRSVIEHAINKLEHYSDNLCICCLYATAPFAKSCEIAKGLEYLKRSKPCSVVFTATSFPFPIQRAVRINSQGYSRPFDKNSITKRSQDLEEYYHDAGQFYWAEASTWLDKLNILEKGRPMVIPRYRVQDIDTEEDWIRAELMHEILNKEQRYVK